MIKCKKCNNYIAPNVPACPVCGAKPRPSLIIILGGGFLALTVLLVIWGNLFMERPEKKNTKPRQIKTKIVLTEAQKAERIAKRDRERLERNAAGVNLSVLRYQDAVAKYGEPPSYGAKVLAKYYMKDHYLKDPDSLKIEKCQKIRLGPNGWHGFVQYRAKNSFGGYVRETKRFVVRHDKIVSFQ